MRILRELGYVENQNFDIVYRSSGGNQDRLPTLAEELAQRKPDVMPLPSQLPFQQGKQHPQIATDGCGRGGDDRRSDCALPYRVRPRSIILGMRSARFAIGGAAGVHGQRYLQESPAHSIDRTITKTP